MTGTYLVILLPPAVLGYHLDKQARFNEWKRLARSRKKTAQPVRSGYSNANYIACKENEFVKKLFILQLLFKK